MLLLWWLWNEILVVTNMCNSFTSLSANGSTAFKMKAVLPLAKRLWKHQHCVSKTGSYSASSSPPMSGLDRSSNPDDCIHGARLRIHIPISSLWGFLCWRNDGHPSAIGISTLLWDRIRILRRAPICALHDLRREPLMSRREVPRVWCRVTDPLVAYVCENPWWEKKIKLLPAFCKNDRVCCFCLFI